MKQLTCKECNSAMFTLGTTMTLVGYSSPPGHDHDDNCRLREYVCENGHRLTVSKRNKCPKCDWKGKLTCFCHTGEKVDEWPEDVID
jgi:hypothetical protein